MATKPNEDDILKCGICDGLLNSPIILPCLHMNCQACLHQSLLARHKEPKTTQNEPGIFKCSRCTTSVPVPNQEDLTSYVNSLPVNKFIEALISRASLISGEALCGPCKIENLQEKATVWCSDCNDNLCAQCHRFHKKTKALNHHKISDIKNIEQQKIRVDKYCSIHQDQNINAYCSDHEHLCCQFCVTTNHRKCDHVRTLEDVARNVTQSDAVKKLSHKINDADEITREYIDEKRNELKQLENDKQNAIKRIKSLRMDIIAHLDKLESKILGELNVLHAEISKEIENLEKQCSNSKAIVTNCKHLFNKLLEKASDENVFLDLQCIQQIIKQQEVVITGMTSNPLKLRFEVTLTPMLRDIPSSIHSLGILKCVKLSPVQQNVGSFRNIPKDSDTSMRDCKAQAVEKFETDKCDTILPHGVELLPDSRLLLTFYRGKSLCLCDNEGNLQKEVTLPSETLDVTMVNDYEAAVSYESPYGIAVVDINAMNIKQQNIMPNRSYNASGLTAVGGNVVVACDDRIVIIADNGAMFTEVKTPSLNSSNRYITALSNKSMCYTIPGQNTLVCIGVNGTTIFAYTHDELKRPMGVTSDNEGFVYVAGMRSSNVHQISPEGHLIKYYCQQMMELQVHSPYILIAQTTDLY